MKNILRYIVILLMLSMTYPFMVFATEGEFWVKYDNFGQNTMTVHLQSIGHAWDWNGSSVIVAQNFDEQMTFGNLKEMEGWDQPKNNGGNGLIPWGLIKISMNMPTYGEREFYVDLRDEGWISDGIRYHGAADCYIHLDQSTGNMWIQAIYGNPYPITTINNGDTVKIWEVFDAGSPKTDQFLLNIYLANIVQTGAGDNIATGTLKVNGSDYSSNTTPQFTLNASYTIGTNNERFTNYNGSDITYKHHHWNTTVQDYLLSRLLGNTRFELEQRAQFVTLSSATLQSYNIDGATLDIEFQDPWYKEQNGTQPGNWKTYNGSFTPPGAYGESVGGIFKNQNPNPQNPNIRYYSIRTLSPQSKNGIQYLFTGWTSSNAYLTAGEPISGYDNKIVVFTNDNAEVKANYKAQLATGDPVGYSNSGQRKVIRTPGGYIHMVYASAGKIWYEIGVEETGGITWYLMNGSQPINGTTEAKSPSITYSNDKIVVTYQEKYGSNNYKIVLQVFAILEEYSAAKHYLTTELANYSTDANPVISLNPFNQFVAIWKQSSGTQGLYYYLGAISSSYQIVQPTLSGMLSGTTSTSHSPAVDANRTVFNNHYKYFQCAYTHGSAILYRKIYNTDDYHWAIAPASDISYNSGYTDNYSPSIIAWGNIDARVAWVGKRWEAGGGLEKRQAEEEDGAWVTKAVFKDPSVSGTFWSYEDQVSSVNIQKNIAADGSEPGYIIGWSAAEGAENRYSRSSSLVQTNAFNVQGSDVQIIGGTSWSTMYGTFLNPVGGLFKIERSSSVQSLGKQQTEKMYSGRSGIAAIGDAEFYFAVGDVTASGQEISFKEKHDTLDVDGIGVLNEYLTTEPFQLTDQSEFLYSVQYGFNDSAAAVGALSEGGYIDFRLELVDDATNAVIGEYDAVRYTETNVFQHAQYGYIVNTSGIGSRTVRLRLVVASSMEANFALNNIIGSKPLIALGKGGILKKRIGYKGSLAVTEYSLGQNFPNPFNPSTTISYALPQDGLTTLKVYDALGREVAELVNEFKTTGRYTTSFDASRLSSGVYVYKLVSGKYTASKKMMLVK
ncbi:T9SS type A sorting domain-containing protein [Zoogloea sp.]|uniref:T9SS type A sorting domain-containing protein n=1 Tax=Zoogloea sp. TaxID=49181 RepID=UPI001416979A|nr:MAG: T9SS type A sorting domain-containing protein [Zoogloea sp.]